MRDVLIGVTDYTVFVKIKTDAGAAATGLDETDIDIAYARVETDNDVTTADVTPAALTALTDAHTDWGFEVVSDTDHPGLYRLDIADAVFASGAWEAVVTVTGTGLDPTDIGFRLVAFNPLDAVRLGLTALPNAAAGTASGLPITSDLDSSEDIATAWGSRVIGNTRTADYFLQGGINKVALDATGTTITVYGTDDTTVLWTGPVTRLATNIGGFQSADPT